MPRLAAVADFLVERIRVNSVSMEVHDGRSFWVKRRRLFARPVLALANAFFRIAHAQVHAVADVALWQRWEIDSFRRLHGEGFRAFALEPAAVAAEKLPGVNLTSLLDQGTLNVEMAAAAGRELRRAHTLPCAEYDDGLWSHGDPHIGNFVYDPSDDRARLIDFEMMHDRRASASERHANDVQVVLQDMLGRATAEGWSACAGAFLDGYDSSQIAIAAVRQLDAPRGVARYWWAVRTSWLAEDEAGRRIAELRAQL